MNFPKPVTAKAVWFTIKYRFCSYVCIFLLYAYFNCAVCCCDKSLPPVIEDIQHSLRGGKGSIGGQENADIRGVSHGK